MSADLAKIESDVLTLADDAMPEQVLSLMNAVDVVKGKLKAVAAMLEQKAIEYIEAHGPIECGDMRYIVGTEKIVKCRNVRAAAEKLIDVTGGDWDKFAECLSSGAFKYGSVRTACADAGQPEIFDVLFETTEKKALDSKPLKRLQKIDTRFVRSTVRACDHDADGK